MAKMSEAEFLQKMAEILGLPADSNMAQVNAALDARLKANKVEAAETEYDQQLVNAAHKDGRIPADRLHFWSEAMKTGDRRRNRQILASLTPTKPGSAAWQQPLVTDDLGLPINPIPERVMTHRGKPLSEYTADDHYATFANSLGARFRAGAPPVPQRDSYYQPGSNDFSRPVVGADGVVTHFEDNPDYQPHS
jgi:hypothetical protein